MTSTSTNGYHADTSAGGDARTTPPPASAARRGRPPRAQIYRARLATALTDPVRFTRGLLGVSPWSVQESILRSVATHPRTAVRACHASGKTFIAAAAVLWWITRWNDGIVITTAPTWTQVERVLWSEIRQLVRSSRLAYPEPLLTALHLAPNRFAIGLSTDQGVRFQGFHSGRVLVVIDEAPGVAPAIWEAIEGIRAGGDVRVLALGNPTVASGPFYDAFTRGRAGWSTHTISAFDTPNLAGLSLDDLLKLPDAALDHNVRPYLTTRRWVFEKYHEWGEQSPLWQARVLGQFPDQTEDALISLAWLEAARARTRTSPGVEGRDAAASGDVVIGIDVAGPGEDETAVCVREDDRILALWTSVRPDPRGEVAAFLAGAPWRDRITLINVDAIGIGYYFARHLRDLGYPVREINVSEAPVDRERYSNLKAELYWGLRMRFERGDVAGLTDETTIAQLASIRYEHNARGQIVIESKEQLRKRGARSPDRAEAMMLAFAAPRRSRLSLI